MEKSKKNSIKKEKVESEIKVGLGIHDFECEPEEITKIIGLTPTQTWKKGDQILKTIMKYKANGWRLSSPCDPFSSTVEEQVNALLDIIIPHAPVFSKLPRGTYIELSCFMYTYKERPLVGFTAEQVKKLAQIGAAIDLDIYDLSA